MKIGEVEVFLNYGQLVVGSGSDPDFDLLLFHPPANDAHHIMLYYACAGRAHKGKRVAWYGTEGIPTGFQWGGSSFHGVSGSA